MPLVDRHCRAAAGALLALVALGAGPEASFAQSAMGVGAERHAVELQRLRAGQRRSVEVERLHTERRRSVARAEAHARMPSTMYASTPDSAPPPHAVPLDIKRAPAPERSAADGPARPPVESPGHRIPLFVSASDASGAEGYVRIVNHSDGAGEVRIEAFDDAGESHGPVTLSVGAGEAVHLSAAELEQGSAAKGLTGSLGGGEGDWRLEVTSALDLEVLAYVRSADGFLSAMHDVVPRGESGHRVAWFNAGSNAAQASRLRIVNPGAVAAEVRIEGIDDAGAASAGAVTFSVPAQGARTLGARELEAGGEGLGGALGTGTGRWRLVVSAEQAVEVLSLIASASGHLANVSTVPAAVGADAGGARTVHRVPWLPAAARSAQGGVRGLVRIVNRSDDAGEVRIEAFDDAGVAAPALAVAVGAREAVELSSEELESGSADAGLSGGVGAPGEGDWWLRLNTSLDVEVAAYVQSQDGFVSAVHDAAPRIGGTHRVGTFNPASETTQASRLRIVNPGTQSTQVRIEGIDDAGEASGGAVTLTVAAKAARTLGAAALESGEGASGGLGDGTGRWRLLVRADTDIEVMSLLSDPSGHVASLSTAPGAAPSQTAEEVFAKRISAAIVQAKCVACHAAGAGAGFTRLRFERASNPEHRALNLKVFEDFLAAVDDGAKLITNKIQGVDHGGGVQFAAGTPELADMQRFLALLGEGEEEVTAAALTPQTLFDTVQMAPTGKTLRRAALIFAGRNPTEAEYAAAQRGATALRRTIRGLMTGPEFHEFLIRGANDRLLTNRGGGVIDHHAAYLIEHTREAYRRAKVGSETGDRRYLYDWDDRVQHGARRAPLELIAHVVENDRPYTEILTANYIMANPWSAQAYGASTRFRDPEDVHEFRRSRIESYYRHGEGHESEYDPAVGGVRIIDPGPLGTNYPHAGILNTNAFLLRYPTTATNRNRARSRWTYYHFLGLDIEKSASRTTDPDALADTNNPTLRNPACTVCHTVLDPVAGAFQNYGDDGWYKDQWGGEDSLDEFYKRDDGSTLAIQADSWENRDTLSWPAGLAAGVETLRVVFTNDFYDEATGDDGMIYLDRVRVLDPDGRELVRHEFESLGVPIAPWGPCGERRRNPVTRSVDHVVMWNGHLNCAYFIDVDIPTDGIYRVEISAWADRHEQYEEDGFAKLSVTATTYAYQDGDTWYRDMRSPGFAGALAPSSDNSVQWLARKIVTDKRFAEATVKFWWPAIMGSETAEPPADEGDSDFDGLLLAANAQGAEVERLARGFRSGFSGGRRHNLKDLLVEIVLSKWFRADGFEDANPVRQVALRDAGARRLLTPEELARKTAALTGVQWNRGIGDVYSHARRPSALTEDFRLFYGGIDSDGITERGRDMTSTMAGVAKRNAAAVSCPVVMRELYLLPDAKRRLFAGIDPDVTPGLELEASFEIEAGSWRDKETLVMEGRLASGSKRVRLSYLNDYWDGRDRDRNVRLGRLDVRNSAGKVIASRELKNLDPASDCNYPVGDDHFALHCNGSVDVPIEVPATGTYSIEVVAWADQFGDELAKLSVAVIAPDEEGVGSSSLAIRNKLVELHDKLLGVRVTPHSPDVEAAYRLFVDVMEREREAQDDQLEAWQCGWWNDLSYLEGILDNAVVRLENDHGGWYFGFSERAHDFVNGIDWSDPNHSAQAWVVVLAYLLMDYRYLHL